jgi:hypothetical protein
VTWTGAGPVKIELLADVTTTGSCLTGPSVVLVASAPGNSALVTIPSNIATTRGRIQVSRVVGSTTYCDASGAMTIATPPPPNTWSYHAVDTPNHGWNQSDMCPNWSGGVDAVYLDYLGGENLKYASRIDKTRPWVTTTAKDAGAVGSWPAIVRGSNGVVHVAYYDHTVYGAKLHYTSGSGNPIAWGPQEQIQYIHVVQGDCAIALDYNNTPYVAFNSGNQGGMNLKVYKRVGANNWVQFGATIPASNPHHLTLRHIGNNQFWLSFIDQSGNRMNLWKYNGVNWVALTATFPTGPYVDASLVCDPFQGNPMLAYTVPNTPTGGQKLIFHAWSIEGTGLGDPVTVDSSPGTIASVSIQYGYQFPRIGYVGNGVVKQLTGVYSETAWPCAWNPPEVVDATGNMDSQVSLVVNIGNDERWFLYRDLNTQSMRSASPYYVDTSPPPAITDLGFAAGKTTGVLYWTTPDDGNGGQAVAYDLRQSISPINEGNFYGAGQWPIGPPEEPGTPICIDLTLSSCQTYYWAIETQDEWGNWSAVSNSPGDNTSCIFGAEVLCGLAPQGPPRDRLEPNLPQVLSIGQVMPNPARSAVRIALAIPASLSDAEVRLTVFDVAGRRVHTLDAGRPGPGIHELGWDLSDANGGRAVSGVYFVRVKVGDTVENRRVMLVQ